MKLLPQCGSCLAAGRPPAAASSRVAAAAAAIPADSDGRRGLPVAGRRAGFPRTSESVQPRCGILFSKLCPLHMLISNMQISEMTGPSIEVTVT
jgi:hypothetical protein